MRQAEHKGRVQDCHVLLTGAGSGIGRGIARLFAREGAKLYLVGRDERKLQETCEELEVEAHIFIADLGKEEDIQVLRAQIEKHTDHLDSIVNNAGTIIRNEDILETPGAEWDDFIAINLKAPFLLCQAFIPLMLVRGKGSIVNIASQLTVVSAPGYSTYTTAKGGIMGFTRSLAIDFGPRGIRANCISPGVIETPMAYIGRENFDEIKGNIADILPLKRIGKPEDVAYAALYLASDESAWVTGTNLIVDGGYTSK